MDFLDGLFFIGLGAVCVGVWCIHPPSAFIVGGSALVALSVLAGRKQSGRREK